MKLFFERCIAEFVFYSTHPGRSNLGQVSVLVDVFHVLSFATVCHQCQIRVCIRKSTELKAMKTDSFPVYLKFLDEYHAFQWVSVSIC